MKKIAIIGAGGFGREVHLLLDEINKKKMQWEVMGYIADASDVPQEINGLPFLGGVESIAKFKEIEYAVIAIANPMALAKISKHLKSCNIQTPNIIHPSYEMDGDFLKVGVGNIFSYGFYMTRNIEIGDFNIFNSRVTVGHDVKIGSFNVFMPNVQISGGCSIGDLNTFGMNSGLLQNLSVGSNNSLGAHSFMIKSISNDQALFGCPAKKMPI